MKCLIINSSARSGGNSALALDLVEDSLPGAEVERVDLAALRLGTCLGCRLCFDKGEAFCPHKDGVLDLYDAMRKSELIVIGGPIYVEDVNGIMKNWIDRMAFNCHRPGLFEQKAYILLTSGGGASRHALKTLERALATWGVRVVKARQLALGAKTERRNFPERLRKALQDDMGKALKVCRGSPGPTFLQLMTFHIQRWYYLHKMDRDSHDYRYWREKGWLDKGRDHYSPVRAGSAKRILAKMAGNAIIKFVLR